MKKEDNGIKRFQLILGTIFAAASVLYLLAVYLTGMENVVTGSYFPFADEMISGSIPETAYSPFAIVFLFIPRMYASTPFDYNVAFVAEVFVFFLIGLVVVGKLAKRYYQNQRMIMIAYTALLLMMFEFVVDRYDIFPAILTLLSFYCLVTKNYVWAFVLLSIAAMTNLYPVVLFPLYILPFIINRDWSNTLKGTGAFFGVAFLIILPFVLLNQGNPESAFNFLFYHMDRPLHIESVAASIIAAGSALGLTDTWIGSGYGTDNLMGPLPDAIVPFMIPIMLLAVIIIYAVHTHLLIRLRKDGQDSENNRMIFLGGAALLSILAVFLFGKALPPQHLIWLFPFVVFMLMTSINHISKRRILVLSVLAIALTQLNYFLNIGMEGGGMVDGGVLTLLARSITLLILFVYIIKMPVESVRKGAWHAQAPMNESLPHQDFGLGPPHQKL